jgi:hypothetical protein
MGNGDQWHGHLLGFDTIGGAKALFPPGARKKIKSAVE